jgi:hypothetical protein
MRDLHAGESAGIAARQGDGDALAAATHSGDGDATVAAGVADGDGDLAPAASRYVAPTSSAMEDGDARHPAAVAVPSRESMVDGDAGDAEAGDAAPAMDARENGKEAGR